MYVFWSVFVIVGVPTLLGLFACALIFDFHVRGRSKSLVRTVQLVSVKLTQKQMEDELLNKSVQQWQAEAIAAWRLTLPYEEVHRAYSVFGEIDENRGIE